MTLPTDYQNWYTGETVDPIIIPLMKGSNTDDITNVPINYFTLTFRSAGGTDRAGTGQFTLITANPAVIAYKFSPADVAASFTGQIFIKALFPPSFSNADEAVWDGFTFNITAS